MGLHFYDDDYSVPKRGCDIISDITGKYLEQDRAILFEGQVTELSEIVGEESSLKYTYEKTHGKPFHISLEEGVFKVDKTEDSFELLKKTSSGFLPVDSEYRLCKTNAGSFIFEDKLPFKLVNVEDYLNENNLSEYKISTVKSDYTVSIENSECFITDDNGQKIKYDDFNKEFYISSENKWLTEGELNELEEEHLEELEDKYKNEYDEFFHTNEYTDKYDPEYYPEDYE